jgi:hypothetical protein
MSSYLRYTTLASTPSRLRLSIPVRDIFIHIWAIIAGARDHREKAEMLEC